MTFTPRSESVRDVQWNPSQMHLFAAACENGSVHLYDRRKASAPLLRVGIGRRYWSLCMTGCWLDWHTYIRKLSLLSSSDYGSQWLSLGIRMAFDRALYAGYRSKRSYSKSLVSHLSDLSAGLMMMQGKIKLISIYLPVTGIWVIRPVMIIWRRSILSILSQPSTASNGDPVIQNNWAPPLLSKVRWWCRKCHCALLLVLLSLLHMYLWLLFSSVACRWQHDPSVEYTSSVPTTCYHGWPWWCMWKFCLVGHAMPSARRRRQWWWDIHQSSTRQRCSG